MKNRFVIVGAGHGGVQLAVSLRETGFEGEITLFGEEAALPYHRPPLSKAFLADENADIMPFKARDYYADKDIDLQLGVRIEAIKPDENTVVLADGSTKPFDYLALATGSVPRVLPIDGVDGPGVVTLRTQADAQMLRSIASGDLNIAIVGGGFIGLEVAATLKKKGNNVRLFEIADRLMGRAVAPEISAIVFDHYQKLGIEMLLNTGVDEIVRGDGEITGVIAGGETFPADLVIMAVGGAPDVVLATDAGLKIGNGIVVDEHMRTSVANIFALGDAVEFPHPLVGRNIRLESVQNALDQARHIANCLAGNQSAYDGLPWFWSDQDVLKLQMAGLPSPDAKTIMRDYGTGQKFAMFHLEDGVLTGAHTINSPADHLMSRRLIGNNIKPTAEFLADPEKPLKALA